MRVFEFIPKLNWISPSNTKTNWMMLACFAGISRTINYFKAFPGFHLPFVFPQVFYSGSVHPLKFKLEIV